jgi:16S rRNA (uracil1498-N3)-methyltransferase
MRRLVVAPNQIQSNIVQLTSDQSHYLHHVLRLTSGTAIQVVDGSKQSYLALVSKNKEELLIESLATQAHPVWQCHITLCQALSKGSKIDTTLRQNTELGVDAFIVFSADRSIVNIESESKRANKIQRWQRINEEAARQSNRSSVPAVSFYNEFASVMQLLPLDTCHLVLSTKDALALKHHDIQKMILSHTQFHIWVGPEGGFTDSELEQLKALNAQAISLGPYILRTENAGFAACAALFAQKGFTDQ